MYAARKVYKGFWNHEPFSCLGLMEGKNSLTVCLLGLARPFFLNPGVAVGPYRYTAALPSGRVFGKRLSET
jgi:hypothetical protein